MRCVRNRGEAGDEHTSLTPQPLSRALNGGRQDACPTGLGEGRTAPNIPTRPGPPRAKAAGPFTPLPRRHGEGEGPGVRRRGC